MSTPTAETAAPFYTSATLDLSGWWRCVFAFTSWHGRPVDAENHPPQIPQLFSKPGSWQETTYLNLGFRPDRSTAMDFGAADDRLWTNHAQPADGGDGVNGYLVQISDQRRQPDSSGVQYSAGSWLVTAFAAVGGVGLLAALFGNPESMPGGDVNYLIARAPNPTRDGRLHPDRPEFTGTWIDIAQPSAGTVTLTPMSHPPAFPSADKH